MRAPKPRGSRGPGSGAPGGGTPAVAAMSDAARSSPGTPGGGGAESPAVALELGAAPSAELAVADTAGPRLVERLRGIHQEMVEAVVAGEGLDRVAAIAGRTTGAPVAIVVPRLGVACAWPPPDDGDRRVEELARHVADRVRDRPSRSPGGLELDVPIVSGDELIGAVVSWPGPDARDRADRAPAVGTAVEVLHCAAVAALTEVAVFEARQRAEQNLRGSFLEELRSRPDIDPLEIVRRAARLGCDLARGAVVLCAELTSERPAHLMAMITGEYPGALAQLLEPAPGHTPRIYALVPAAAGEAPAEPTLIAARRLAARLSRHGSAGLSSFCADPAALGRAMQEAEMVVDVLRHSHALGDDGAPDMAGGTYRLLFRVLASHPEEVRSFYEDTVSPLVRYDDQYRTDLVGTLESYLEHNCSMNATASAIYAHRHTVAYRLERVRELTGLDPLQSEDRERLGLGLKVYRIIAPRLPR
jgi:sugar diacid utilization regulator